MGGNRYCSVAGCQRQPANRLGYCGAHYLRVKSNGDAKPDVPIAEKRPRGMSARQVYEYFLPPLREHDSCWEWQGVIAKIGYGQVTLGGSPIYAHRLSWELHNGGIPKGMQVRHDCDNRKCVNPRHLQLGTFYDNMQDAVDRRRFKHAEQHWNSKLDSKSVREIRELAKSGLKHADIATSYGVGRPAVTNIINRVTWKDVT